MTEHFKRSAVFIAIFAITASFGLYFRSYPATQNIRRHNLKISRMIILANLRKELAVETSRVYPLLNEAEKKTKTDVRLQAIIGSDRDALEGSVNVLAENLTSSGALYLLGADPYYYYRLTKNLLRKGRLAEKMSGGRFFDPLMTAPIGRWRNFEIHPYTGFLVHKAMLLFNENIELIFSVSVVPMVLYLLCLALFILCCKKLKMPGMTVLISGFFFSLAPIFIQRSCAGWYDTDPYNVIFPLAALFLMAKAFDHNKKIVWIAALSLLNGIYSVFWQGWLLLVFLVSLSFFAGYLFRVFTKKPVRDIFAGYSIYLLGTLAVSAFVVTPSGLSVSLSEVLGITGKFSLARIDVWPDIFLTIGELKRASPLKIMHLSGGPFFVFFAIYGFFSVLPRKRTDAFFEYKASICVFTAVFAFMSAKNERFVIFLIGPASLCFAYGLNSIYNHTRRRLSLLFKKRPRIFTAVYPILFSGLLIPPMVLAHISSSRIKPIFNETWDSALKTLKSMSPENSIVNSWWPPGHFIRAIAERGVTFDGATPEVPQSYWVASFFMSDNESEAAGILRMLNTSGNMAFDFLVSEGFAEDEAVELLKKMAVRNESGAVSFAEKFLDKDKAFQLAALTHGPPPPSFCLIYNDLMKNVLGLYYVSEWDFSKALAARNGDLDPPPVSGSFVRGTKNYISLMWRISGGMPYIGEESFQIRENNGTLFFSNGVSLDTSKMTAYISSLEGQISGTPESIILPISGGLSEKQMEKPDIKLSVLFIRRSGNRSSCIVAPSHVLKSVIFRLYYLNGTGLTLFEPFILEENPTLATRIMIYRIKWPEE